MQDVLTVFLILTVVLKIVDFSNVAASDVILMILFIAYIVATAVKFMKERGK